MKLTKAQLADIIAFDANERPVTYWHKPSRKTLRYNYIVRGRPTTDPRTREVTVHHVAVRLDEDFEPEVKVLSRYSPKTNRVAVRDIGYHGMGGWVVYWTAADCCEKSVNSWTCYAGFSKDYDRVCRWGDGLKFPWHRTINPSALEGTRYQYAQYSDGKFVGLCDWLYLYRREPHVETLAKLGLYDFMTPVAVKAMKNRRVRDWVIANRARLARGCSVSAALWAARRGKTLAEGTAYMNGVSDIVKALRYDRDIELKGLRLDYARVLKILEKCDVKAYDYARYLNECRRAGLDLRNEGTLYPPTSGGSAAFIARIEALEAERVKFERRKARAERARVAKLCAERQEEIAAFQRSLDRAKTLTGCGYSLILAKTQEELVKEGRRMSNCVGIGIYGQGIAVGDKLILTMQGADAKERYCIEIDRRSWSVRQCYGRHNSAAPDAVHELAKTAARELRAEFKKMEKRRRKNAA